MSTEQTPFKEPNTDGGDSPKNNQDAEVASFFIDKVLADHQGLTPELAQSSDARVRRVMGLMGLQASRSILLDA